MIERGTWIRAKKRSATPAVFAPVENKPKKSERFARGGWRESRKEEESIVVSDCNALVVFLLATDGYFTVVSTLVVITNADGDAAKMCGVTRASSKLPCLCRPVGP